MKPKKLQRGDTIAIVSLSSGMLGEKFASHELEIARKRLTGYDFRLQFMPNALKGIAYLQEHPEARARDMVAAFENREVKAIICAIGGDDTYRLAPFLFEGDKLKHTVADNPKIFLGFSDTTVNHFILRQCGLNTFYGQALMPDVAELDMEMLPYTKKYFEDLFVRGVMGEITASPLWYEERTSFGADQIGVPRRQHPDNREFDVIKGSGHFTGKILGGCLESLYDMLTGDRYPEEKEIVAKYRLFPSTEDWEGKILLLETSEEQPEPKKLREMLTVLRDSGIFRVVSGVIIGKPMDEKYYDEYRELYWELVGGPDLSVVYNVNVGHATPRAILPFGVEAEVIGAESRIVMREEVFA